jgi:RsiW-degrading membrane proteinase PrsW (M82 family)
MEFLETIILSVLGGVVPALAWLAYWLREDKKHPEPNSLLIFSFILGMITVPIALIGQWLISTKFLNGFSIEYTFSNWYLKGILVLIAWALIEELLKYSAAYIGGLSKKANNEPIDPMIYLITAALGFSALENTLFIFTPLLSGDIGLAFITGNLRFIGATLLHISSSAIIGIFLAFSYYKKTLQKNTYLLFGFILSIALHTIFNSFIIRAKSFTLVGFSVVWIVVVAIILIFERIKKIRNLK